VEFYRSFAGQLEIRSAAQGGDGRTVYGPAVPFDLPTPIDDQLTEEWDRGAFNHQLGAIHRVPLYHGHRVHGGVHVGHLTMARADVKHLYVEGRVSETRNGDEYLTMVRDGSVPDFSIGFAIGANGSQVRGRVTRRMRASLTEVAGVPLGAFGEAAAVAGVRAGQSVPDVCPACGQRAAQTQNGATRVASILASLPILPPAV
jgi:HK97 family phage prohead protease